MDVLDLKFLQKIIDDCQRVQDNKAPLLILEASLALQTGALKLSAALLEKQLKKMETKNDRTLDACTS